MPESTFELQNLGNKPPIPPRHPLSTGANSELDVVQHESVDNVMSVWAWASAIACVHLVLECGRYHDSKHV